MSVQVNNVLRQRRKANRCSNQTIPLSDSVNHFDNDTSLESDSELSACSDEEHIEQPVEESSMSVRKAPRQTRSHQASKAADLGCCDFCNSQDSSDLYHQTKIQNDRNLVQLVFSYEQQMERYKQDLERVHSQLTIANKTINLIQRVLNRFESVSSNANSGKTQKVNHASKPSL